LTPEGAKIRTAGCKRTSSAACRHLSGVFRIRVYNADVSPIDKTPSARPSRYAASQGFVANQGSDSQQGALAASALRPRRPRRCSASKSRYKFAPSHLEFLLPKTRAAYHVPVCQCAASIASRAPLDRVGSHHVDVCRNSSAFWKTGRF
jgi:hypothetical protein